MAKISSLDLHKNNDFMQQDKVSIIIACYNDAQYIAQSINSAFNQTWANKEIIVIDDGSNSETKKVLSSLSSKIDTLITQKNMGVSAARNNGIARSIGEYILILDSDDYFELNFIEKAIPIIKENSDIKIITCHARWFWDSTNFQIHIPNGGRLENFLISNASIGNSLFRKSDFLEVGGYDEELISGYEDWELFIRLHKKKGFTHVIPEILFHYRKKKNSRSSKANKKKYELLNYIYLKHADVYKKHFSFFIKEWLENVSKSEAFKQQVMDSLDYKIGNKLLKPFRLLGFFNKAKSK